MAATQQVIKAYQWPSYFVQELNSQGESSEALFRHAFLGIEAHSQNYKASAEYISFIVSWHWPISHFYEDRDGAATEKSIEQGSKRALRLVILGIATAGMAISALRTALATYHLKHPANVAHWMEVGIWFWLLLQCIMFRVLSLPTTCFAVSWRVGVSSGIALLVCCIRGYVDFRSGDFGKVYMALYGLQISIGIMISTFSFMIPRRPDVFHNGIVVDRQFTTSLLGWVSFSWIEPVLRECVHSRNLTIDGLPELDHSTRAETVYNSWKAVLPKRSALGTWDLWWSIFRSHFPALLCQMIITVTLSFLSFAPQIALLRILNLLEAQQRGEHLGPLWVPVVGLGLSVMSSATLETLKYWISFNKLAIRVQQQLSLAIFRKATCLSPAFSSDESGDCDADLSPVNIVAADIKNIADFLSYLFLSYESPIKLSIASVFLTRLLGWRSLLAGAAVLGLLTAFNAWAVWKYSGKQTSLMEHRDSRLRALAEMLGGIRQVKFSALENRWEEKINQLRDMEMQAQWTVNLWQIAFMSMYFISPILLSAACISVYVVFYGDLSAATAFTALSVMSSMEVSMAVLPDIISFLLNARVSMERIKSYLEQSEHVSKIVPLKDIEFQDATIAWPGCCDASGSLRGLSLKFPRDSLSIITGPTGSGKSLLLASILGETDILSGSISAPVPAPFEEISCFDASESWVTDSAIAFVSQSTWLQNATVRDNILLGLPLDRERYDKVVFASALEKDFELLPGKDRTEIRSKGANLSGGQRWRICLARALYSRAHTLLLDDIFSALDVHTREHIYQYAFHGELLRRRTCILVTHHLELCLPLAKYLVRLENGVMKSAEALPDTQPVPGKWREPLVHPTESPPAPRDAQNSDQGSMESTNSSSERKVSAIILREGGGILQWSILAVAALGFGGFMLARSWWIHIWTDNHRESAQATVSQHSALFYLGGYLALSALACVFGTCRTYFSLSAAFRASQSLFRQMLFAVLRAPIQWYDTVPMGHILSRFSADFNALDSRVGVELRATLEYSMDVAMAMIAGTIVNPMLLLVSAVLLTVYFWCARWFITASRHLKGLENAAKGPLLEDLDTTIGSLSSVRAFGQVNLAIERFQEKVGRHARAFWHLWLLNRWLGFRINIIGAAFSALSAAMVAYVPGINPSMAGFAIGFTIEVSLTMALSVRCYANLEQGMNSVKRIHSFSTIPTEKNEPLITDIPEAWPEKGKLEVSQLVVRPTPYLPPVLKGIDFTVTPNTRVGVVGRTGAGKSSLVLALFRFLEASEGKIMVDGIDISRVPLDRLRSRLAIIPQHPMLFRGTVRSNLDPVGEYDDSLLISALQAVGWEQEGESYKSTYTAQEMESSCTYSSSGTVCTSPMSALGAEESTDTEQDSLFPHKGPWGPLDQPITDCGGNISHGQQQLLCLARAIIRQPKIMIMDEATSAVDKSTEDLIQRSLRSALSQCETTLLVIAHRLKTIADSDMVLVMDCGMIVESGSPQKLLRRPGGVFRGMVEQDPERDTLENIILRRVPE
ncbi:hypothetical protein EYZ11_003938 [Aspergillus tanneri]|uniref:ABC transporter domain-containing protein n=1 Tax=Aspergillus tanneri TaxID=1220188 RepID=A0A4S3JP79_9EURO|nr:hypothetical protein EYZ11_003938 [Aspergillus tanneri]